MAEETLVPVRVSAVTFDPGVAERVVKAPLLGVVLPIVPGATQVAPIKLEALIVPVPV